MYVADNVSERDIDIFLELGSLHTSIDISSEEYDIKMTQVSK